MDNPPSDFAVQRAGLIGGASRELDRFGHVLREQQDGIIAGLAAALVSWTAGGARALVAMAWRHPEGQSTGGGVRHDGQGPAA